MKQEPDHMTEPIIDTHQHLFRDNTAELVAEACRRVGIVKAVVLGLPERRVPGNNAAVLQAARDFPELFVPFAAIDLDTDSAAAVDRFRDDGFCGIKAIGPSRAYNDAAHFPVYERAAELGLPIVFHLGIVSGRPPWNDCDSNLMRPIHLDHIARRLPELTVIGAHLGNPWYEEATMACRWNPNLYFDLSGSTLKKKRPSFLGDLLWWQPDGSYASPDNTWAWEKILFGSDVAAAQIGEVVDDYRNVLTTLDLAADLRTAVWSGTAARLLGIQVDAYPEENGQTAQLAVE